jgi:hypothetical protein
MYDSELMNQARDHYELTVKAAERAGRLRQRIQDEPGLAQRLLGKLGHLLVRTGERLQREYAPEMGRA